MKLVNLIPLKEIDFKNQDQFDAYSKAHELRPSTKVTIAGKVTTAGQAAKESEPTKGSSVFGKDSGGSVFGKSDSMATVNSIASMTGLRTQAVAGWADENGVNLSKVADDIKSKKLKPMDFMTAVSGNPGNKYAKDVISKYSQSAPKTKEISNNDIEGLTSYKDFNKFFKAHSDKLNKDDVSYIEDEIGALKYLESDYRRGDADREEVEVAYIELQDLIKKGMSKGDSSTSKFKPFDADADTKDFANALPKGFSKYLGGTIDGVTSFTDDAGNNIFVSEPSDDKENYGVSGYNDDISNTNYKSAFIRALLDTNYKSFKDKQQAIEYAKQLAIKLSGSTKLSEMIPTKIKK